MTKSKPKTLYNGHGLLFVLEDLEYLITLKKPLHKDSRIPCLTIVENFLYVIYNHNENNIVVFDCEDHFKKVDGIRLREVLEEPRVMVGCNATSQLFILEGFYDAEFSRILRVDLNNSNNNDTMIDHGDFVDWGMFTVLSISLFENRLLIKSVESVLIYDINSREILKTVRLPDDLLVKQSLGSIIESNRDSFFAIHRSPDTDHNTVSEIDCEGHVIRVLAKEYIVGYYSALDSVGRLLVGPYNFRAQKPRFALLDEHLKLERILSITKRLESSYPWALCYGKRNNLLAVGFRDGEIKVFKRG